VEYNAAAALGELPGSLASGKAATCNMNGVLRMGRHALRIALRDPLYSSLTRTLVRAGAGAVIIVTISCASGGAASAGSDNVANSGSSAPDQAWVDSACLPASVDTTGWRRHRIGDFTIQAPAEYRVGPFEPYNLNIRGPGGSLTLVLHRNAIYLFDTANRARRFQNWCQGTLGGYQAEIVSWHERFRGAAYNFAARLRPTVGTRDEDKWLFVTISASRLQDAQKLRDAMHTLAAIRDTSRTH
jgi:hypothetical protein